MSDRENLKNYCLRSLGEPLIKINISEPQLEDRIDDALNFFAEFHMEGKEEIYLKHKVTASYLTTNTITGTFTKFEKVTGGTSGAFAYFIDSPNSTRIRIHRTEGTFTNGETVTGTNSGASFVVSSFVLGDLDNKWIPASDNIISVVKILPISNYNKGNDGLFDIQYQFALESMNDFNRIDLSTYFLFKQHLALIEKMLVGERTMRFNRYTNKLHIDMNWIPDSILDRYLIIKCHAIVNPTTYAKVYSDRWLREYTTALIKKQWGSNLKKFGGLQLPGGVVVNGQDIYSEAMDEIKDLKEEARTVYTTPCLFSIG